MLHASAARPRQATVAVPHSQLRSLPDTSSEETAATEYGLRGTWISSNGPGSRETIYILEGQPVRTNITAGKQLVAMLGRILTEGNAFPSGGRRSILFEEIWNRW